MPRMARLVVPGYPHHVTQRGARRQATFFGDRDYADYLALLDAARVRTGVGIWAYCLMPNHVHIVAVPRTADGLAALFRDAHREYTRRINEREGWRGHLWQERFHSCVLDESHLLMAVRYVERNPVRAGLCRHPQDWPWSSVHAHLGRDGSSIVDPAPMGERVGSWSEFLRDDEPAEALQALRRHASTGRPAGNAAFRAELERRTGVSLRRVKPGRRARIR